MSAPFLLDCCAHPNHCVRYHDPDIGDGPIGHEWYCKSCGKSWSPAAYDHAARHDEDMAKREVMYFDYGRDRV